MAKPDGWGWTLYWGTEWGKKTFQIKQHRSVLLTSGLPPSISPHSGATEDRSELPLTSPPLVCQPPKPGNFGGLFLTFNNKKPAPAARKVQRTEWSTVIVRAEKVEAVFIHHSRGLTAQFQGEEILQPYQVNKASFRALSIELIHITEGRWKMFPPGSIFKQPSAWPLCPSEVQWCPWQDSDLS